MTSNDNNVSRTGNFRAVVRAGNTATEYVRSGSGRPVILLTQAANPLPLWNAVIEAVAERYRLIAPDVTPGTDDFAVWLGQFLDGLGLTRVLVLADGPMSAPAIGYAMLDPDRVARLIVITPTAPPGAEPLTDAPGSPMIIGEGRSIEDIVGDVLRVLDGAVAVDRSVRTADA
ncbi:MAG: alpha/beta fold hydrolase [Gemmatimonadales bacterium]